MEELKRCEMNILIRNIVKTGQTCVTPLSIKKKKEALLNRPIRLTQCCTQFKPFGNKSIVSGFPYHLNVNATL